MTQQYKKIVMGGTFDLLHIGHKQLLNEAFKKGQFISIGLTTDLFNIKRKKTTFEKYSLRKKSLEKFLNKGYKNRFQILPINDIYGNSLVDQTLEAIITSPETIPNAILINKKRKLANQPLHDILMVPHLKDSNSQIISSSRIRSGEIDQLGNNYLNFLISKTGHYFNIRQKSMLKKPFGKLLQNPPSSISSPIITVGDITTQSFLNSGIIPNLAIIDFKTQRKTYARNIQELGFKKNRPDTMIENLAGQLSAQMIDAIKNNLNSTNKIIQIVGEEDLAVVPAVLLSPLQNRVYYGQPGEGMIEIIVTPQLKQKIYNILQF